MPKLTKRFNSDNLVFHQLFNNLEDIMLLAIFSVGLCLSLAMIVHEAGHFIAFRCLGIKVTEIGLGFNLAEKVLFRGRAPKLFGDDVDFIVNYIPFGAYVRIDDEGVKQMNSLPFKEYSMVAGAGILANFFGSLIFTLAWFIYSVAAGIPDGAITPVMIVCGSFCLLFFLFRGFCCQYLIPLVGTLGQGAAVYIVFILFPEAILESPLEISSVFVLDVGQLLVFCSLIQFLMALLNSSPFLGSDGFRIVSVWVQGHSTGWSVLAAIYSLALLGVIIGTEIYGGVLLFYSLVGK